MKSFEDFEKVLLDLTKTERDKRKKELPPQRPPYSYTSICPDEKYRITKRPAKLKAK